MKVLVDANVIMDFLVNREPYVKEATALVKLCSDKEISGFIAAHTISNLFFILRKQYSISKRREMLLAICNIFDVSGIDREKVLSALINESINDFEDCLQFECAKEVEANFIITRNLSDFASSTIKAIEPKTFLEEFYCGTTITI